MTKILVVGCSYAGIAATKGLLRLAPKAQITVVSPRAGFINIMATPRLVTDPVFAAQLWVGLDKMNIAWDSINGVAQKTKDFHIGMRGEEIPKSVFTKVDFVQDRVTRLEKDHVMTTSGRLDHDFCVLALGSGRPIDIEASTFSEFKNEVEQRSKEIEQAQKVCIVGGGAVGIEMAEIKYRYPEKEVTLIHPHPTLPPEPLLPDAFKEAMANRIQEAGLKLRLSTRVKEEIEENGKKYLVTTTGDRIETHLVIWTNKAWKNNLYVEEGPLRHCILPAGDLRVNQYLQPISSSETFENTFVAGDLARIDGTIKKAGLAARTGELVAYNIHAKIQGTEMKPLSLDQLPPPKMAITIGSKANVQFLNGKLIVDSESVMKLVKDYKNAKTNRTWGLA